MGGDNFAILTSYDKEALKTLRDEIRKEIRMRSKTTGYPPAYGIYVVEDKNESAATMYERATVALSYVIGNYTSHCCEYNAKMDGKREEEIRLLFEIQEGIENDEFTFFVQPQFDITKAKIVGGESLVRWIHGNQGMISPGVFIPVLEKNGFIADLDQIVWDKVCQWLRMCIDKGYQPVPISVNVSRIDIFSIDVPAFLISLVEKYDIPAELLKVEITESAYAEDGEEIVETVKRLRDYGFIVMMDDFGSGYSSLNMLKSVPVDVLKMDMRFLEINENEEEKGIGILESVINMARQMRIPIVVEGVETQAQENLLKKMGCCYTQGFFYYKPMALSSFEELLSDDNNLDHTGFWYRQAESVHLREFLDTNLFNDTVINNILGAAVFYDVYDNNIEITRVNDQYFRLAGIERSEEEDYRKRFWNSVRDDDIQLLHSIFAEAYDNPITGATGFINFLRRDGVTLWVNIRVFFLREKDGHKIFYASLSDMTDVKADTVVPEEIQFKMDGFTAKQREHMEKYYGNLPCPFGVGQPVLNEAGEPVDYIVNYANKELARMSGGNLDRLKYLIATLFKGREKDFLDAAYRAAYQNETINMKIYSNVSNRYFDINIYPYRKGYACCMMQDVTHSHIYEKISGNIMTSFREVYFLQLQDNYCRMIFPNENDLLNRGVYEEVVSRHFESGKIRPYDEKNVREFLALENIRKELKDKDSIEYKYKRSVEPAGEEWCLVTISVSERKDGVPKTATITIRSIEVLMREREDGKRQTMAQVLATMSDGFFVYNAAHDEKIVFANPPVIRMFGCKDIYDFRAHVDKSFKGFVYEEDLNRVEWEIAQQQNSSERNLDFIRYRIKRKDGEIRWVEDVGYLETSNNDEVPEMFYVFVWDITDTLTEAQKNKLIRESEHFNK
ncbi:MAG: EAL domain-containing protein [Agathobacter sp.]|nr:EAL domain-containing protein [Agathobacter sp.]